MYGIYCFSFLFATLRNFFEHISEKFQFFSKTTKTIFRKIVLMEKSAALLCACIIRSSIFTLPYVIRPSKVSVGGFLASF